MLRRLNLFRFFLPCCLLGLVLIGLGGKLWLIFNYGTPVPDAAQWRGGIAELAPEWAAGDIVLSKSATPVEFPVLARATLGALIHANRQWDDRVTTVVNALLLALAFALVLTAGGRRLGWMATWAAALCAGAFVALPLGWEQSLAGSALPDRLALLLALPAAWSLFEYQPSAPAWWGAALALLCANAAADWAVAVAVAVGLVAAVHLFTRPAARGRDLAVLGIVSIALGAHGWLHSGRWSQLDWPGLGPLVAGFDEQWPGRPWLTALLFAPLLIRLLIAVRDPDRKHSLAPFAAFIMAALAALLWLAAEQAPRTWGTGAAATDILLLLTGLAFATLTQLWFFRWGNTAMRLGVTVAWIAILVTGLHQRLETTVGRALPARSAENARLVEGLQRCLQGMAVPYATLPSALRATLTEEQLKRQLANPALRAVLPFPLQRPIWIEAGPATTADFVPLYPNQFSLPAPAEPAWAGGPAAEVEGGTFFVSLPLPPAPTGVIRFRVAGDLGSPRFPFALRSTRTGEFIPLELDHSTGERWRTINLSRPADPVMIVAGPASLGAWGAFTHPVEMGDLSWYASKLAKNWAWVLAAGTGLFALALILPLAPRKHRRETAELDHRGQLRVALDEEES